MGEWVGLRRVQMGRLVCRYGGISRCRNGSVYIASLRLGGRKLPTYELTLRLLGVATMYGWIYYISVNV